MDLLEYQGKQLFKKHGLPLPDGRHAASVPEAIEVAEELGFPVVIKAQVQIGGRGKAGGIKLAGDRRESWARGSSRNRYGRAMRLRSRIVAFGSAGALVVAGAVCIALIDGLAGQVLAIALISLGLGGALLLAFFEVGLSEEHDRARDARAPRRRAGGRAEPPRHVPRPGWWRHRG